MKTKTEGEGKGDGKEKRAEMEIYTGWYVIYGREDQADSASASR